MMLNVAFFLDATAARKPAATAIVHEGRRTSYAQLQRFANQLANGLAAAGYGAGDRIAICCNNRTGFAAVYYAVLKTGATAVVLSDSISAHDLAYELEDCGATALFVYDGTWKITIGEMAAEVAAAAPTCRNVWAIPLDPMAASTVPDCAAIADLAAGRPSDFATRGFAPSETALILYTSGSTGRPKGVELTQANLTAAMMLNQALAEPDATRVRLVLAPMADVAGQIFSLNLPVLAGETMVLVEEFEPREAWRLIVEEGVTYMAEMPIFYRWLLDHADGVDAAQVRKTLRLCPTGGAALPLPWSEEFEARFGVPIRPGYGMTEATATVTWNCPFDALRTETVGKPIPGVALRIVDDSGAALPPGRDGQIEVRSPGMMKGYLNNPAASAAAVRDGWLRTNDVGRLDEAGYLLVQGRADGMITRGFEHIYPAEIVNMLYRHPVVKQVAVKAVPHDTLGQDAKAFVTLNEGCAIEARELLSWLSSELPANRAPGLLQVVPSLPLTRNGKIAYHLLS
ncbi:MAG: class I adenylate-forming enzyme family protein [Kiloniellales bacterium]